MNRVTASRNVRTGDIPANHVSVALPQERAGFCGRCVSLSCFTGHPENSTDRSQVNKSHDMSYKSKLDIYNNSHVLEKTAGKPNLLGTGIHAKVERYKITVEDTNRPGISTPVYSTNDNEGKDPVDYHETPAFCEQEIAYKTATTRTNKAKLKTDGQVIKEIMHRYWSERSVMNALDHQNIIKSVTIEGDTEKTRTKIVIETRSLSEEEKRDLTLSEEEKQALATKTAGNDSTPKDNPVDPDFDFEVVESVRVEPVGIPLPLMETTLAERIQTGLSPREKDTVARAMIDAVAHAHQRGYVHLDINPSNILNKGDNWLLADWSTAHHYCEMFKGSMHFMPMFVARTSQYITGTLQYAPPQIHGRSVIHQNRPDIIEFLVSIMKNRDAEFPQIETDARAIDAYSLGMTLCELFTGAIPINFDDKQGFKDAVVETLPDVFQEKVDAFLQRHHDDLGGFNTIIAGLLQSEWTERMTVPSAQYMLDQIPMPQQQNRKKADIH